MWHQKTVKVWSRIRSSWTGVRMHEALNRSMWWIVPLQCWVCFSSDHMQMMAGGRVFGRLRLSPASISVFVWCYTNVFSDWDTAAVRPGSSRALDLQDSVHQLGGVFPHHSSWKFSSRLTWFKLFIHWINSYTTTFQCFSLFLPKQTSFEIKRYFHSPHSRPYQ